MVWAGEGATVVADGYRFRLTNRPVFLVLCELGSSRKTIRLLEGKVDVSGPDVPAGSRRSYGFVSTPEAAFLPRPGDVDYHVTRVLPKGERWYRSRGTSHRDGGSLWVRVSSLIRGAAGRKVPCRQGRSVAVGADGDISST